MFKVSFSRTFLNKIEFFFVFTDFLSSFSLDFHDFRLGSTTPRIDTLPLISPVMMVLLQLLDQHPLLQLYSVGSVTVGVAGIGRSRGPVGRHRGSIEVLPLSLTVMLRQGRTLMV